MMRRTQTAAQNASRSCEPPAGVEASATETVVPPVTADTRLSPTGAVLGIAISRWCSTVNIGCDWPHFNAAEDVDAVIEIMFSPCGAEDLDCCADCQLQL